MFKVYSGIKKSGKNVSEISFECYLKRMIFCAEANIKVKLQEKHHINVENAQQSKKHVSQNDENRQPIWDTTTTKRKSPSGHLHIFHIN